MTVTTYRFFSIICVVHPLPRTNFTILEACLRWEIKNYFRLFQFFFRPRTAEGNSAEYTLHWYKICGTVSDMTDHIEQISRIKVKFMADKKALQLANLDSPQSTQKKMLSDSNCISIGLEVMLFEMPKNSKMVITNPAWLMPRSKLALAHSQEELLACS